MATVCGGALSLLRRGRQDQAGRGHRDGLIKEARSSPSCPTSSATRIISATWTSRSPAREGVTALQMDIKIGGLSVTS